MTDASPYRRQNEPLALSAARAFRRRYTISGRWRSLRVTVGFVIGTLGVLAALIFPATADYISAAAAAWIVTSRALLQPAEHRERQRAASAQELFDTTVFSLPWIRSVTGVPPAVQDIRTWGRHQNEDGLRDWYPDTRPSQHPADVLLCQRWTITWARQDHALYARVLRAGVLAAFTVTLIIGVLLNLSLGAYLLRLGVPILPAGLDVLDMATGNAELAVDKAHLESEANDLLARCVDTKELPDLRACRDLQNGIYATRLKPGVPQWIYRLTRADREDDMNAAAQMEVEALPQALKNRDSDDAPSGKSPVGST
jgi:hypothetical protein